MKKLLLVFALGILLTSCNWTSSLQDMQFLQTKYPTVYRVDVANYVCIDSIGTYHIRVTTDGQIYSKVKIE
jgi:hypothetical protein